MDAWIEGAFVRRVDVKLPGTFPLTPLKLPERRPFVRGCNNPSRSPPLELWNREFVEETEEKTFGEVVRALDMVYLP